MLIQNHPELYAKLIDSILQNQLLGNIEERQAMVEYISRISKIENRVSEYYEHNLNEAHKAINELSNQLTKLETAYAMNDDMILRMYDNPKIEHRFILSSIIEQAKMRQRCYERNPVKVTINNMSIPEHKFEGKSEADIAYELMCEAKQAARIIFEQLNPEPILPRERSKNNTPEFKIEIPKEDK